MKRFGFWLAVAGAAVLCGSCATTTAFERNYRGVQSAQAVVEPTLVFSTDIENDRPDLESEGYRLIGSSQFSSAEYSRERLASQVRSLCLQAGATHALYGGTYAGTTTRKETEPVVVRLPPRNPRDPDEEPRYETRWRTTESSVRQYDYYAYLYVPLTAEELAQTKLGIAYEDLNSARRMALRRNTGAYVSMVYKGTPAFMANIVVGDVVTQVNGTPITYASDLAAVLAALEPGQTVPVTVYRDGTERVVQVAL